MLPCGLLFIYLLTFQESSVSISVGKAYPSHSDNPYKSDLMLNISGDYLFRDNLKGSLQYSHTWLEERTKLGWESKSSNDLYATLSTIKRVFNFADISLFGGGGFVVNPEKEVKMGVCCGLGMKREISSSVSFEFNFRIQRTLDEVRTMRDWKSFYMGLNFRVPERIVELSIPKEDEAEIIIRYLAAGLEKSPHFSSDKEINDFIEEFWTANDPIPQTTKNEFREEILSRIEYANRWFEEKEEGWKTHRGRIWIILGEPDEIVRDETAVHPTERWIYNRVYKGITPLIFVFKKSGTYRQVLSNVPGEFGYDPRIDWVDPPFDRSIPKRW